MKDDVAVVKVVNDRIANYLTQAQNRMINALSNCESPIEQLVAIELANSNLTQITQYNDKIKAIDIKKQIDITINDKRYRVDFLITFTDSKDRMHNIVIECDSFEYHATNKQSFEYNYVRTRELQSEGYNVLKFTRNRVDP